MRGKDNFSDDLKGGDGDDQLFGLSGNDKLAGGAGGDLLDGGLGADRMAGGRDSDLYIVDNLGDAVIEEADGGSADTVRSTISYTLGASLEILVLDGSAALTGTGNGQANLLPAIAPTMSCMAWVAPMH